MLDRVREDVPVFVTVTIWGALVVPLNCVPKVRLVGAKVTPGVAP